MIPHKCPVCNGTGEIVCGYFGTAAAVESCRACVGTGIVWEKTEYKVPKETLPRGNYTWDDDHYSTELPTGITI